MDGQVDPRARRTRDAIVGALVERVFRQRYDAIRTGDLIAAAGVGRSTFYAHFRSKDAVLLAAMEPILLPLANAAAGRASAAQLRSTLAHVWERRSLARAVLGSAAGMKLQRRLAAMIGEAVERRDGAVPPAMLAMAAAAAQLTMLRMWVGGEATCSVADLASRIMACARLVDTGAR
ncbi:MAG: helix-turn-helix domain containing protein [Sphingomonas sp.]|uniref:TetR/AcrR family transcriptional regulator n=1 Tax=Sphingomonas sp. TaxID=28214 RepID=UPI00227303FC|nr:helix-turn-helix domain-containing protein [Sphingomonas sp.]MCX8477348.1 helix-turn-helix domain containing protein [Sphingomonas sp.]